MVKTLTVLANRLNKEEYAAVTSVMSLMAIGHTFELSEDGFEFINLAVEVRRTAQEDRIADMYEKKSLQNKIVKLKPKDQ